jgi:hypothetical protein
MLIGLSGCSQKFDGDVVLFNSTGRDIKWCGFKGAPELVIGGVLLDNGCAVEDVGPSFVLPEVVTVYWEFEGGGKNQVAVTLRNVVPSRYHGDLVFEIMPDETVQLRLDTNRAYLDRPRKRKDSR